MYNFKRGQKIVCVDDDPRHPLRPTPTGLHYGRVYTVDTITLCSDGLGVQLVELPVPIGYMGFYPDRFRPAVDRKENLDVFYQMLTPKKVDVPVT